MVTVDPSRGRSTRDRPSKAPLSERAVIDAGLAVLRREGLDAVTMRRVARELDTGAASLYVYVEGRDDLWRLLFDEVAGRIRTQTPDPARWRAQLRDLCVDFLEALEAHPGIARVALAEIPTGPNALACAEALLSLLLVGGVEPQRAAWACDVLALLVTANAVESTIEHERATAGEASAFDPEALRRSFEDLPADRFPNLSAHAAVMTTGDGRERFIFAIDTFVDGLVGRR